MYGLDLLAGAKYKKEAINNLPAGWALGIFAEAFGDAFSVVEAALKKGCPLVRVQLLWSDTHSFGDKDIPKLKKLGRQYAPLAEKYRDKVELSFFCEHNVSNPDKYGDILQSVAPFARIVNCPWKGKLSTKYKNEIHGKLTSLNGPYNFSFDGTNCVDTDMETYKASHKNAEVFFFWWCRFNLKWSMKDDTPRPNRNAKPTKDGIKSIVYLASDKGDTKVLKKWIIKSHSEKHNATDAKGDKLLIISPIKASEIVLKRSGRVVGRLKYYGPYSEGGHRYYSASWGYELGKSLEVWIGSKQYGVISAGFRDGVYR